MKRPTERQIEVIKAMAAHYSETGRWPTVRRLSAMLNLGDPTMSIQDIMRMEKKGMVAQPLPGGRVPWQPTHYGLYCAGLPVCTAIKRQAA